MKLILLTALMLSTCAPAYADTYRQLTTARMYCDEHRHYTTDFVITWDAPFFSQNCPQLEAKLALCDERQAARDEAERLPAEKKAITDALKTLADGDR